jgi:hypothetical protein
VSESGYDPPRDLGGIVGPAQADGVVKEGRALELSSLSDGQRAALYREGAPALDRQHRAVRGISGRQVSLGDDVSRHQVGDPVTEQVPDRLRAEHAVQLVRPQLMADVVHETGYVQLDVGRAIEDELMGALQPMIKFGQSNGALRDDRPKPLEQREQREERGQRGH